MLKTNYTEVSKVYDKNKSRTDFPLDKDLEELLSHKEEVTVLDLACGTGNWLYWQQSQFNSKKIKWIGMDASEDLPFIILKTKKLHWQKYFLRSRIKEFSNTGMWNLNT